ncbi:hypothetical protein BJY01DRAFT_218214 [Aspergillus pseudoustus]|uniref:Uncharacterized protein n=1 Tax=Aspergillus pseudoustus TaxID=1810923 RepID=A0ABR4JKZ1_9EURO
MGEFLLLFAICMVLLLSSPRPHLSSHKHSNQRHMQCNPKQHSLCGENFADSNNLNPDGKVGGHILETWAGVTVTFAWKTSHKVTQQWFGDHLDTTYGANWAMTDPSLEESHLTNSQVPFRNTFGKFHPCALDFPLLSSDRNWISQLHLKPLKLWGEQRGEGVVEAGGWSPLNVDFSAG